MRNPSLHNSGKGLRMIVLVSLIVLLRGFPGFHDFSHGASLHPYLNDFCTCISLDWVGIEPHGTCCRKSELNFCNRVQKCLRSDIFAEVIAIF